jgi:type III restriction enzyme
LATWCKDINNAQSEYTYRPVYVKQEKWEEVKKDVKSFADLVQLFEVK